MYWQRKRSAYSIWQNRIYTPFYIAFEQNALDFRFEFAEEVDGHRSSCTLGIDEIMVRLLEESMIITVMRAWMASHKSYYLEFTKIHFSVNWDSWL